MRTYGVGGVVTVEVDDAGVAVITMADRQQRNMMSPALTNGLVMAFDEIAEDAAVKVVLLQGYDRYFCCGGTKQELIDIQEGRRTFTDFGFYRLLLDCEVPVICAMQGHAVGAGLAFGCYGDLIVMGEECLYTASFMKYGFTPGFGATYIIPAKLGPLLGSEMLFSARGYHGADLRARGASPRIVEKARVPTVALELARDLAEKPRLSLMLLKEQLARPVREALPGVVDREIAMHARTFPQAEVRDRIERLF